MVAERSRTENQEQENILRKRRISWKKNLERT